MLPGALPVREYTSEMMKRDSTSDRSSLGFFAMKSCSGIDTWHHAPVLQ